MTLDKERLRVLAEAATPGPWGTIDRGPFWGESEGDVIDHYGADVVGAEHVAPLGTQETTRGQMWLRDAEFIAAARDAVPALLSENAALAAEVERLRAIKSDLSNWGRLANRYMNEASGVISTIDPESETEGQEIHALQMALYDISIQWVSHSNAIDAAMADKGAPT